MASWPQNKCFLIFVVLPRLIDDHYVVVAEWAGLTALKREYISSAPSENRFKIFSSVISLFLDKFYEKKPKIVWVIY